MPPPDHEAGAPAFLWVPDSVPTSLVDKGRGVKPTEADQLRQLVQDVTQSAREHNRNNNEADAIWSQRNVAAVAALERWIDGRTET